MEFSLNLSLGHLLLRSMMLKWWPSDKFKENFETYLKVHCYAAIIKINYEVFRCMASPEYQVIKTHGSESRGQEEAACMRVFWPTRPLQ